MYANGEGVPKDAVEAVKWWHLAAEQGDAGAQANLGFMYENGQGVPEDDVLFPRLFHAALVTLFCVFGQPVSRIRSPVRCIEAVGDCGAARRC
jgi:TPR repeat protein